ncbi:MAG: hypothetical protein ACTS9Y_05240 [Methylophilus sp.]
MASDPNAIPDPESDTVVDPNDNLYEEAVEKPLKDSENFVPSEEL